MSQLSCLPISHAHLYDYGNGMYAMFTNMIQTNPKM
jgi:hypothetical protein